MSPSAQWSSQGSIIYHSSNLSMTRSPIRSTYGETGVHNYILSREEEMCPVTSLSDEVQSTLNSPIHIEQENLKSNDFHNDGSSSSIRARRLSFSLAMHDFEKAATELQEFLDSNGQIGDNEFQHPDFRSAGSRSDELRRLRTNHRNAEDFVYTTAYRLSCHSDYNASEMEEMTNHQIQGHIAPSSTYQEQLRALRYNQHIVLDQVHSSLLVLRRIGWMIHTTREAQREHIDRAVDRNNFD